MTSWSYWAQDAGPEHWAKHFPSAHGRQQSPINIKLRGTQHDRTLARNELQLNYDPLDCVEIRNIGTTWSMRIKDDAKSTLQAPHLPGTYRLKEVHAHWGSHARNGSEHTINNRGYAAEIHLVHCNAAKDFNQAKDDCDGLAVLGIMLKETRDDNPDLAPLVDLLKKVVHCGQTADLPSGFDLTKLLPNKRHFCTYRGSLTTPPCSECVIWTVFQTPVLISSNQMRAFRSMLSNHRDENIGNYLKIVNNVRPVQPLHDREVKSSNNANGCVLM